MIVYAEEAVETTASTGINFADIIFTAFVFLILLLLMRKLVFKKVLTILDKRESKINTEILTSEENLKKSAENLNQSKQELSQASVRISEKFKEATDEANQSKEEIISSAKYEAKKILQQASLDIEAQSKAATEEMKKEAIEATFTLARTVLKKEVSPEDNQKTIDEFLNNK